jgi:hypothetical protein
MAEAENHIRERVAERLEHALAPIRELETRSQIGVEDILIAHAHAIEALTEVIEMLATEIDRIKHRSDPPSKTGTT